MHLQAGEWSLEFRDGDLRHVRAAGAEAVERIYFALRDDQWGTIPFTLSGQRLEADHNGFHLSFHAEHKQGPIHFRWRGGIEGRAEGLVRYTASCEALTSFRRNRIGLCVHHPLTCAGKALSVTHPDGTRTESSFPKLISPHQPLLGIRSMAYEIAPGRLAEISCNGDIWETEDQRNWSDANFKTYPTPLALPYPVEVAAGTKIEHSVEVRLKYAPARHVLPIGLTLDSTDPLPVHLERLHRLRIGHLRVEQPGRLSEAARWNLPVELALTLGAAPDQELAAIRAGDAPLARVIVYRTGEPVADARSLALVKARFPGVPVIPGANPFFAELNRNRTSDFSAGVAFGLHPQVHASDDESIMANLASHDWMVETARSFAGTAPLILSPVQWGWPGVPDPRLRSAFGAAWTRGAAANFARLGVATATFHTVGDLLASPDLEKLFT